MGEDLLPLSGDVEGGWRVFTEKRCIECHAVWNLGGKIGPDLGRTGGEHLTASDLAGMLWNHIPRMHSYMVQRHVSYPILSIQEVSNLFSFLYFARDLEDRGDARRGERVFREKSCAGCHLAEGRLAPGPAPHPRSWTAYSNPIVWTLKMWEHAPQMERAVKEAGATWPQLESADIADIIAYVRSLGGRQAGSYLRPGSQQEGERLFVERGCRTCHVGGGPGSELTSVDLPETMAGLASRMWNHSPQMAHAMTKQGLASDLFTPQEMADIVAYLLSLRHSGRIDGDPQRGRQVFLERRCIECHNEHETDGSIAPHIQKLSMAVTPVAFAQAIWNHGVSMLDVMSKAGRGWPLFQRGDVADLIAYLESLGPPRASSPSVAHPTKSAPRGSDLPSRQVMVTTPAPPPVRPGESCVSNTCHSKTLAGRYTHAPTGQGECDACHGLLDPQRHAFALVSETSDLCYRCHDRRGESTRGHEPVSVSVCTACHEPHGAENPYGPDFTGDELCFADMLGMTNALATLVDASAKESAYLGRTEADGKLHRTTGPSLVEPFVTPVPRPAVHETGVEHAPTGPVEGGCLTGNCHVETVSGPVVHTPLMQQQCEVCHRLADQATHRFELTSKEPALCYQCHEQTGETGDFVHGPLGLGLCTPCHSPHSAPYKSLLPETGSALCFNCHSELAGRVGAARVAHKVITENERSCLACHSPHRSEFRFQLRKAVPELCYTCHPETHDQIEAASVPHGALTSDKACGQCHDVHGSSVEKILVDGEMNLCLGCHNQPMDTKNGTIVDMKSWIETNPERHGPIREGLCTVCHIPHGSQNFRLLRHNFPREFYRPFSVDTYALCFDCHEQSIVLDPRTTALTAFRNGDKNLHYVHVNQEKGRTCRACHEVHAGTKPKRMKDFVPFGQWKYPVGFEVTSDGGRCAPGCHTPRAYSRNREIVQK